MVTKLHMGGQDMTIQGEKEKGKNHNSSIQYNTTAQQVWILAAH